MTERSSPYSIGIDLGGTKIEGIVLHVGGDVVGGPLRVATPRDYEATLSSIEAIVRRLEQELPQAAPVKATVGIGMPGSISKTTGLVQNANSTWLNGRRLQQDVETKLGRDIRLANDANCFVLSEAFDGVGASARSVFGVILGTGCGGGIVIDGKLIDGPLGIGGEWGHNPLPWAEPDEYPGTLCWCGRHGCMETWVSGPALEAQYFGLAGQSLSAAQIAEAAGSGNRVAIDVIERHTSRLARGLAHVINIIDPEIVVLGGGLSNLGHLYRDLPPLISRHVFADQPSVELHPPRWGDSGGVRGAARLWD